MIGWHSMISSQTNAKYRERYDPPDDYSNELHVSPDLAPAEPLLEVRPGAARTRISPSGKRRSVGREMLRLFIYGLIITAIGGAAFASQYGDDNVKEALGFLQRSVSGLSPDLGANPSAKISEKFSMSSDQVSAQDKTPLKDARAIQSPPAPVGAGLSPQILQQLEAMTTELAAVRGLTEKMAVLQKKMAQDIVALETANLSQKTWWLYQSSAFDAPPLKSVKKTAPSPAKSSPVSTPTPATRAQTP
jgi:hypothetical protein